MSLNARVVHKRRETITALPLYFSGHLQKKRSKDKEFKAYYVELRGNSLFLYEDETQETYLEKLELSQLKSMQLESSYKKKEAAVFRLSLPKEELHLKMKDADTGEEWRGYILTMANKEIPNKLDLLPGQKVKLEDALKQETKRVFPLSRPVLPPRPAFMQSESLTDSPASSTSTKPPCFYDVTRKEAEQMLEENPENGGIILRPSTVPNNYALTLRQPTKSGHVTKNYRVTSTQSGFVIELDTAVTVSSLDEVIQYFLEKTDYRVHPYTPSQAYDTRIEALPTPPHTSKAIPRAQVAPMLHSQSRDKLDILADKFPSGEYIYPDDHRPPKPNLKLVQQDSEFKEKIRKRRENLYQTCEPGNIEITSQRAERRLSGTGEWTSTSSA
ncbi:signal-transducing adaptor protein 1 isoform X1 [Oryzias melastigma]|uniref:signal-transducing adaptor protein 1 isoform X1 n=1 Tax=Oryzias melastigma TaxID=30732 RepID=UPI000CF7D2D0|nr:signal-transducing adaptor protein 1 isoform X1 [Oryzias melastigma]